MTIALVASQPWRALPALCHSSVTRTSIRNSARITCSVDDTTSASVSTSEGGGSKKHVDTRIHWGSSTEGWIGVDPSEDPSQSRSGARNGRNNAGILDYTSDSHYRYMGVSPNAELEDIKAAYRRLSKQYHPDTTSLPLEIAAQKFMRLKDAYDTLSNEELRNLYDRRLESKITSTFGGSFYGYASSSQQGYETRARPEAPDVDTLGGRNMALSAQALTALAFDLFVLFVCIFVIIFVVYFKKASS